VGRGALRRETGACGADEAAHTEQQDRFFASQKRPSVLKNPVAGSWSTAGCGD